VGNGATDTNRSVLNDAIGKCTDDNHMSHVNNNNNVAGANTIANTLTNDVKSIARFLVVNEADCDMRFIALETIMGEVMKALEENKAEIIALKAKITELEAQMQIND
jgi:CMP-2-keto-3-deoxyoctulosonic acid synthetase